MLDTASSSHLCNRPTSRQSSDRQPCVLPLKKHIQERAKNAGQREKDEKERSEKQQREYQGQRRRRRCSRNWSQDFSAACKGPMPGQVGVPGGTTTCGEPVMEQKKRMSRKKALLCTV